MVNFQLLLADGTSKLILASSGGVMLLNEIVGVPSGIQIADFGIVKLVIDKTGVVRLVTDELGFVKTILNELGIVS